MILPVLPALRLFERDVIVYDRVTGIATTGPQRGTAVQTDEPERIIRASVQPISGDMLEILGEGYTVEGMRAIYTIDINISISVVSGNGRETRQTFLRIEGCDWIFTLQIGWYADGAYGKFIIRRYVA